MPVETIITIVLAAALILSVALHMLAKRAKASSEEVSCENGLGEGGQAGRMQREFGLPADSKGLDSDYAATKAIFNAVLSEGKSRSADRRR